MIDNLKLSNSELLYLDNIMSKGKLTIATREVDAVYEIDGNSYSGFHYNLIKSFTDSMNIDLEIKSVNFKEYWTKDGLFPSEVMTDPTFAYTPDLLKSVDVYIDSITVVPWREQIIQFIPIHPIKEAVVHKSELQIESLNDLKNLTPVLVENSSFLIILENIEEQINTEFEIIIVQTPETVLNMLEEGLADFSILDMNYAVIAVSKYDSLKIGLPFSDINYIGWVVDKNDTELASILQKYVDFIKKNGVFNEIWENTYPINFIDFIKLLAN